MEEYSCWKEKVKKYLGVCVLVLVVLCWLGIQYLLIHLVLPSYLTFLVLTLI